MSRTLRRFFVAFAVAGMLFGGLSQLPRASNPVDPVANAAQPSVAPSSATIEASAPPTIISAIPSATPATNRPAPAIVPPTPAAPLPGAPALVPTATPALRALLDAHLERWRAKTGTPGVSVAIVFADGTTWHGNAGFADVAGKQLVTDDTAFSIASVSKTFTAALILGLVEDGRLRLDATARSVLPKLPIDPAITVRQLLDHTSGLRDFYLGKGVDKALLGDRDRAWDAATSLRYVGKPYFRPGTAWRYSNTNYLVLGMIAEAVGRAPVATQLRERFLAPLGLDDTWYQAAERARTPVAHAYRLTGTKPNRKPIDLSDGTSIVPFTSVVTASGAAGSMASTAADLARWVGALYGGEVLEPTTRLAMVAGVTRTAGHQPQIPYGLGVQAVEIAGHATLGHSGRFLGARAAARWLPSERVAITVLTNQSRADPNVLLADLLAIALEPQPTCVTCQPQP